MKILKIFVISLSQIFEKTNPPNIRKYLTVELHHPHKSQFILNAISPGFFQQMLVRFLTYKLLNHLAGLPLQHVLPERKTP